MAGAPKLARTPPPPRMTTDMTAREQRRYLRKLKYNQQRATEGLPSAQREVARKEQMAARGIVLGSRQEALYILTCKFHDEHDPTDEQIQLVENFVCNLVRGKMAGIGTEQGILMVYKLSVKKTDYFEPLRQQFLKEISEKD